MAEVIWGLATSHVPSIGAAMDRGKTEDASWKDLFDGYAPARAWLAEHRPDVAIVIYNDHANGIDLDVVPTFAIGTSDHYDVADEGFGKRPVPDVVGMHTSLAFSPSVGNLKARLRTSKNFSRMSAKTTSGCS